MRKNEPHNAVITPCIAGGLLDVEIKRVEIDVSRDSRHVHRPGQKFTTDSRPGPRPETVSLLIVQHADRVELYCEHPLRTRIIEVPYCEDREREVDLEAYVDSCLSPWWKRLHWPACLREVLFPRKVHASEIRDRRWRWSLHRAIERAGRIARGETGVRHG